MADPRLLEFKLTIDGKEAVATLDVLSGKFIETGDAASKENETVKQAYEGLTAELQKYSDTSATSAAKLVEYISTQNLSVDILEKTIQKLDSETKTLTINSEEWKQKTIASANLKAAYGELITQSSGVTTETNKGIGSQRMMNMVMMDAGHTFEDGSMMMQNFRIGMMGLTARIPAMVDMLVQVKLQAGESASMFDLVKSSLMGGGGLILGFNALMFVLNVLPGLFDKGTESITKQTDEVKKLKDEYKKLTAEQINNEISDLQKQLDDINKKHPASTNVIPSINMMAALGGQNPFIFEQKTGEDRYGKDWETVDQLNQKIGLLKTEAYYKGDIDEANIRIAANQEKVNHLNKDNFSIIVSGAKSYDEAKKKLEDWIKIDQKLVEEKKDDKLPAWMGNQANTLEAMAKADHRRVDDKANDNKEYLQLAEDLITAEKKHTEIEKKIRDAKTEDEYKAAMKEKDTNDEDLQSLKETMKKKEEEFAKEMESWRKRNEEKTKDTIEAEKFNKEKEKFNLELAGKTEIDPLIKQQDDLKAEEILLIERAQFYGATEAQITNIKAYYEKERVKIAHDAHVKELEDLQSRFSEMSSAYNSMYSIISKNVKTEVDDWKKGEEDKLKTERSTALAHAQTQAQKDKVNAEYDQKEQDLQTQADAKAKERLKTWFELQKALALAEIGINLAKAVSVEWGKLGTLALFTQGLVIATLGAEAVSVAGEKFPEGYAQGGLLPKGKSGIIEGWHNEIIAPEQDFKTYSAELVRQAAYSARNYISVISGNNDEMLKRLDQLNENFKKYADSPPPVNIGDDAISKMDKINTLRKGKAGMN